MGGRGRGLARGPLRARRTPATSGELPTRKPSSLAFGGEDLRTLFITTVSAGLSADEAAAQSLAGALFVLRTDTPGLPKHPFRS